MDADLASYVTAQNPIAPLTPGGHLDWSAPGAMQAWQADCKRERDLSAATGTTAMDRAGVAVDAACTKLRARIVINIARQYRDSPALLNRIAWGLAFADAGTIMLVCRAKAARTGWGKVDLIGALPNNLHAAMIYARWLRRYDERAEAKPAIATLACTFCGGALDLAAGRCRRCSGPADVAGSIAATKRIQDAEWPADENAVRFLVRTAPNARGRQDFYALWWSQGLRRAQFFRGDLDEQVRRASREGVEVEVVERFGPLRVAA